MLLKIKLGENVISSKKILLDTNNKIVYPNPDKEIYPMIISLKENEIANITYQSPGIDGFDDLLKKLKTNEN